MTPTEFRKHAIYLQTETATVAVVKKKDDPICTRVSLGGKRTNGFYCTYKGELDEAIEATRNCLAALVALKKGGREPMIAPDAAKEFA